MYKKVLVADDEESILEFFQVLFRKISAEHDFSFEVTTADSGGKALQLLKKKSFDLVICDVKMPDLSGLDLLKTGKTHYPGTIFLMITAFDNADTAVEAMKMGACDYIHKPFNVDKIKAIILSALDKGQIKQLNQPGKIELKQKPGDVVLLGNSPGIQKIRHFIKQLSGQEEKGQPTSHAKHTLGVNILITGESGTGKEVVARVVHQSSSLRDKPFVAVNCGAIPDTLIESEMFGHKKGSFTGAIADKQGFFEVADGGTLFLDEIGELPLALQPKLLRALQEKVIRRVGSVQDKKVKVRLMAATNRDLETMVREGLFREDLFYRLNVVRLHVPPLRERAEDIPVLVSHFFKKHGEKKGEDALPVISGEVLKLLKNYSYPGNVRELENLVERLMVLGDRQNIAPKDILPFLKDKKIAGVTADKAYIVNVLLPEGGMDLEETVGRIEKQLIAQALKRSHGHRGQAAELLHLSLRSFRYRLRKYQMGTLQDEEEEEE